MSSGLVSALLLTFLTVSSSAHVVTITSPHAQFFGRFGSSIDSSKGLLVVGAPYELANASSSTASGLVYVFNARTGSLIRTLSSPQPFCPGVGGCGFGSSVRLAGRYLIVGAPGETVNGIGLAGEVFIFNAETGILLNTLASPNPEFDGYFGNRVAEENGQVYVGASIESANGLHAAGHVYVFNIETGSLVGSLVSPSPQRGGVFGIALAVSDGRLIVGAEEGPPFCDAVGDCFGNRGRAYVFNSTSGSLITTLLPTYHSQFFGNSVAILNGLALVGAPAESIDGRLYVGRVYVYNATSGSLIRTLVSPYQGMEGGFGVSITLAGNNAIIGASGEMAGRAYVFDPATGILKDTIVSPNPSSFQAQFGFSIGIAKNRLYVGAPGETVAGQFSAGAVYSFFKIIGNGHDDSP